MGVYIVGLLEVRPRSLYFYIITYPRWGQSTSYNVAHPACDHKGSTHLSPVHAYTSSTNG